MRIIGGAAKRRGIKSVPASQGVRPILARIKKSLFDILSGHIQGADMLDLYAGSGSVGIEALSRGAAHVTFVDKNPNCLRVVSGNLRQMGFDAKAKLLRADATTGLFGLHRTYDLIFMGPPYHDEKWNMLVLTQPTLRHIEQAKLLKPEGFVIGQHHVKEPVVQLPNWEMFRQQTYGDTRLSFFIPIKPGAAIPAEGGPDVI